MGKSVVPPPGGGDESHIEPVDLKKALDAKRTTSREIVRQYLERIGTYDAQLHAAIRVNPRALAIADSTMFFGNRTDVASLLGQVDVLAFSTTRDEGFGIVLIEAMAAGSPVVASDVAACREVLADGDAGLLVPPSDPAALASSIRQVLNSSELRVHFASRALQRVRSEYSIESCAQRWEAQLFDAPQPLDRLAECAS